MKKRTLCLLLCLAALLWSPPASVGAEDDYLPSLYVADTVWYKDKSLPLLRNENNEYYLPIQAFGALPSVSVVIDETADAAMLTSETNSFSVDTGNGTIISPDGDSRIGFVKEHGTAYLELYATCGLLDLSFEIHVYANGRHAVRINDGSGVLNIASLLRMFAANEGTVSRITGPVSNTVYMAHHVVSDLGALSWAIDNYCENGIGFVVLLDANLVLVESNNVDFRTLMTELYHLDLPISLFVYEENADMMTHYLREANRVLVEVFHKGTSLCTSTLWLSPQEESMIESFGFVLTNYSVEEER